MRHRCACALAGVFNIVFFMLRRGSYRYYHHGDLSVGSGCVCLVCWYGSRQGEIAWLRLWRESGRGGLAALLVLLRRAFHGSRCCPSASILALSLPAAQNLSSSSKIVPVSSSQSARLIAVAVAPPLACCCCWEVLLAAVSACCPARCPAR